MNSKAMVESILVNISNTPMTIFLPSGRPLIVNPGYAVQGDHFVRYVASGQFVLLPSIPVGFRIKGISQPCSVDQIRSTQGSPVGFSNAPKSKSMAKAKPANTTTIAMANPGASTQEIENAALGDAASSVSDAHTFEGLSLDSWKARLHSISDTTFAQQMKLSQLKGLAKFLGIESADLMQTKADFIAAVRIKISQ